ncbi:short-chain dehydrogenase [Mycolicibacterium anyangense]|uniref:Short-chain dehydrogenase n=1 Tax=Mycolicibacterium anyangense TaxID=1431246 RepID=A0A6N4W215_9MYCO|nr:oxidoreductase [Mycolicibacterium anyangense]BBZ75966.1 short-chain dehydrogenase [Mycolicibacterium anyangense]
MSATWTVTDVPDQRGRVALITGANTGLGYQTAAVLAGRGARVVMAVRNLDKGRTAATEILRSCPQADISLLRLDLSSLQSVREAAEQVRAEYPCVDLLINNAGVMWTPFSTTDDGFELHFGTNHLGHFAFTGLIINSLLQQAHSRIVTVSSLAHTQRSVIDFDDLQLSRKYDRVAAYGRSKLSNLLFTYELQRRLVAAGQQTSALAAHPGLAETELTRDFPRWLRWAINAASPILLQPGDKGALPLLRAATDPAAQGGQYYGPGGLGQRRGAPVVVASSRRSHDQQLQAKMWQVSEELTGVAFPV